MALRAHSKFHAPGQRSAQTLATVAAMLAWKLAVESIKRMRTAGYAIDIGRTYFDFVCEFMVFLAVCADRIAFRELGTEERTEFTTALVRRLAEMVEENRYLLLGEAVPGESQRLFLDLFNRRGNDYAEFDYAAVAGPDFGFKRLFAACLREILPEQDKLWVIDQAMDIEAPEALQVLEKTLHNLFHPDAEEKALRRSGGMIAEE